MSENDEVAGINAQVIEDLRANGGAVDHAMGGFFAGKPVLILHTAGAKTGIERLTPLVYGRDGDRLVVAASKGGAPSDPAWLFNLRANPDVIVEVGNETFPVRADIIVDGQRRDELYATMVAIMPRYAEYEAMTDRSIPVVVLEKVV